MRGPLPSKEAPRIANQGDEIAVFSLLPSQRVAMGFCVSLLQVDHSWSSLLEVLVPGDLGISP